MINQIIRKVILSIIAVACLAFGVSLYITVNVGVGAWDVFHAAIAEYIPMIKLGTFKITLTVGTWVIIVGCILVLLSMIINPQVKNLFAVLTGVIIGVFIDFWMYIYDVIYLEQLMSTGIVKWLLFAVSLIFVGSGIALMVILKLPPSPVDTFMVAIKERFNVSFSIAKFITELVALVLSLTLNIIYGNLFNYIGLGTIIAMVMVGVIVQWSDKLFRQYIFTKS